MELKIGCHRTMYIVLLTDESGAWLTSIEAPTPTPTTPAILEGGELGDTQGVGLLNATIKQDLRI